VLDAVASPHSKRNYAKALDDLFAFCASQPLSRGLLLEWRAAIESLAPSTINVRLSAVRKLVGEARRSGRIGSEKAASLTDIPNMNQKGIRLGNWLTVPNSRIDSCHAESISSRPASRPKSCWPTLTVLR
jgi:hypothetical protein